MIEGELLNHVGEKEREDSAKEKQLRFTVGKNLRRQESEVRC
jgi:hypothetical protein